MRGLSVFLAACRSGVGLLRGEPRPPGAMLGGPAPLPFTHIQPSHRYLMLQHIYIHLYLFFNIATSILTYPRIPSCLHKAFLFSLCLILFACAWCWHPGSAGMFSSEVCPLLAAGVFPPAAAALCCTWPWFSLRLRVFCCGFPQLQAGACSRDCSGLSDGQILPALGSSSPVNL